MDTMARTTSFGEDHRLTPVDRFGTWLSRRSLRRSLGSLDGKVLADIGCGFDASFGMSVVSSLAELVVVDLSLSPALQAHPRVRCISGGLPASLAAIRDSSIDVVVLNSVLEHLEDERSTLTELRRIARPGAIVYVNVPTWFGKFGLETSAFRLGLSPRLEIDDHKRYYSRRQLWQAMRDAGFLPSLTKVRRHKFGLNVYAVGRVEQVDDSAPAKR